MCTRRNRRAGGGFCSERGLHTGECCSEVLEVLVTTRPAGLSVVRWSWNGGAIVYFGLGRVVLVDSVGHSLSVTNQKQVNIITIHKETKLFIEEKKKGTVIITKKQSTIIMYL